jgi:hypothetical protein
MSIDTEVARFVTELANKYQDQQSLNAARAYDSSTTRIVRSLAGNDADPEATAAAGAASSEDELPPLTWQDYVQAIATLILFFAAFAIPREYGARGADPLSFSTLAWFTTCTSCWIIAIMVRLHHFILNFK